MDFKKIFILKFETVTRQLSSEKLSQTTVCLFAATFGWFTGFRKFESLKGPHKRDRSYKRDWP